MAIVIAAPKSQTARASFLWSFDDSHHTKESVFKFTNKQNLWIDFKNIWDMCKMKDVEDVEERNKHKLELGVKLKVDGASGIHNSVVEAT